MRSNYAVAGLPVRPHAVSQHQIFVLLLVGPLSRRGAKEADGTRRPSGQELTRRLRPTQRRVNVLALVRDVQSECTCRCIRSCIGMRGLGLCLE
jgi:hypothetical protein